MNNGCDVWIRFNFPRQELDHPIGDSETDQDGPGGVGPPASVLTYLLGEV